MIRINPQNPPTTPPMIVLELLFGGGPEDDEIDDVPELIALEVEVFFVVFGLLVVASNGGVVAT